MQDSIHGTPRRTRKRNRVLLTTLLLLLGLSVSYRLGHIPIIASATNSGVRRLLCGLHGCRFLGNKGVLLQRTSSDCAVAAVKMILDQYGITLPYENIAIHLAPRQNGTSMRTVRDFVRQQGLWCSGWRLRLGDLPSIPLPAMVLLYNRHYAVLQSVSPSKGALFLDPTLGKVRVPIRRLETHWSGEILLFGSPGEASIRWFEDAHPSTERS